MWERILFRERIQECVDNLAKVIDPKSDSVRACPLCADCETKVGILGIGKKIEDTKYLIL